MCSFFKGPAYFFKKNKTIGVSLLSLSMQERTLHLSLFLGQLAPTVRLGYINPLKKVAFWKAGVALFSTLFPGVTIIIIFFKVHTILTKAASPSLAKAAL